MRCLYDPVLIIPRNLIYLRQIIPIFARLYDTLKTPIPSDFQGSPLSAQICFYQNPFIQFRVIPPIPPNFSVYTPDYTIYAKFYDIRRIVVPPL